MIVPLDKFPDAAQSVLGLLPISALSDGLRDVLQHGAGMPWGDLGILAVWAVLGLGAAGAVLPLGVATRHPRLARLPPGLTDAPV